MAKHAAHETTSSQVIKPEQYSHSPAHYAVVMADHNALSRIISELPPFPDPDQIKTDSDALSQELLFEKISAVLDRRDVPLRETPLHLAVRLNDYHAVRALALAGADASLQNAAGWNPLQEALCRRSSDIAQLLVRLHHRSAWGKWRRRLPRLVTALRRMRDFYMEISFHFESSVIPFIGKITPSDTYRIWKRDGNLRADTSLAGFDGLKIQRADQSFLFFGDSNSELRIPSGSLLVLNRDDRTIFDAFEHAGAPMSYSDAAGICSETSVYRPGMDVTKAEFVGRTNWRRQEKTETVGEWKARVYEVHNVVFSFRSRKAASTSGTVTGEADATASEKVLPLELDEDDDGFLVAEYPSFGMNNDMRRHSSFVREDRECVLMARKSVDVVLPSAAPQPSRRSSASVKAVPPQPPRRSSANVNMTAPLPPRRSSANINTAAPLPVQTKEKEYVKSLRPSVWLTEQFPLKTEELLPLLDILANKVKAVRRLRELLTTKLPAGSFPVKVAIPVVPTVKVVITFTKFMELKPFEQFYTPSSSPSHLFSEDDDDDAQRKPEREYSSLSSSFSSSSSSSSSVALDLNLDSDPFAIPDGYRWISNVDDRSRKGKKPKPVRKPK
ncbi:uncharacterized protein LOC130976504 [Arachis stenosperma]|uniref:uncharacterized protein LOC130976504 n=1 Tax=Arachis stenosperma TaxID=217475 RepID=UPI0025ABA5FF|nr:uncharacterized protein LOC130976504 [Arachis stenosperma]